MAGIMFFRIVHMSDWHCESRADSGMENDRDGCLGLLIPGHQLTCYDFTVDQILPILYRGSTLTVRQGISKKNRVIRGEETSNQSVFQIIAVHFYLMSKRFVR